MKPLEYIPINIWDDYFDDGSSKSQETYIYVEEKDIKPADTKKILQKLLGYINKNIELPWRVKMHIELYDSAKKHPLLQKEYQFKRWEIKVKNLTHVRREKLVEELQHSNLKHNKIPFYIYSES